MCLHWPLSKQWEGKCSVCVCRLKHCMEQPCVTVGVHFLHLLNIKMFYNKKFTYTVLTVRNRFSESTGKFIFDLYIKKKKIVWNLSSERDEAPHCLQRWSLLELLFWLPMSDMFYIQLSQNCDYLLFHNLIMLLFSLLKKIA